ncbi:MAG: isopentenyl-diphosphate Delta-isomerase [Candidatus Marsarchaeota archaeon]|nr:isopentenyl-diphosphate Delta-isomerase [Candidatus Marsarchaeota archaeon]MCL5413414.1 isopentenyl-diphosphate Delta-isomerase [Candidatus Marsarchaeota archaeon]
MEKVILVDHNDNELGLEEKLTAHQNGGTLHRAISIFIFNRKGETMLQQRAESKYHGGGLWSNTVCSHPRKGETPVEAAHRRLREEMGFDCNMRDVFSFEYEAKMDKDLTEHEYDHVIFGDYEKAPNPDPSEVQNWKWMALDELRSDLRKRPDAYTPWLRIVIEDVIKRRRSQASA